jgi:hypothetical protein
MSGKRKQPKPSKRPRRSRFKRSQDAHDQLQQIEQAQKISRARKSPAIIESIEKSRQRFRNSLGDIQSLDDAYEQFDS